MTRMTVANGSISGFGFSTTSAPHLLNLLKSSFASVVILSPTPRRATPPALVPRMLAIRAFHLSEGKLQYAAYESSLHLDCIGMVPSHCIYDASL